MNKPSTRSSAEAIALGSKARVLVASRKQYPLVPSFLTGWRFSRPMADDDAIASMVRKYGK